MILLSIGKEGAQVYAHFKGGWALNKNGTWKHIGDGGEVTTKALNWLITIGGWQLPK